MFIHSSAPHNAMDRAGDMVEMQVKKACDCQSRCHYIGKEERAVPGTFKHCCTEGKYHFMTMSWLFTTTTLQGAPDLSVVIEDISKSMLQWLRSVIHIMLLSQTLWHKGLRCGHVCRLIEVL